MSSRLTQAFEARRVILTNRESSTIGLHVVKKKDGRVVGKEVVPLKPGREIDLTRKYTVEELRGSENLEAIVASRRVEVKDTWTKREG